MDIILEAVFELLFEGIVAISSNKKISKWIRYPLITIIAAFYLVLIGLFLKLGINIYNKNKLGSIVLILISILLIIICVVGFKKVYLNKRG